MQLPAYGLVCDLIYGAAELGLDSQGLLEYVGLAGGGPALFNGWLPEERIGALWALLVERTQDDAVALKLGEQTRRNHLINALVFSSCRLSTALERMSTHWHLLYPESGWRLESDGDRLLLTFLNRRHSPGTDLDAQYRLAWLAAMVRRLTQGRVNPVWVGFRAPAPASVPEFYRIFRCPVAFEQEGDALSFADLEVRPILTACDPWLRSALKRLGTRPAKKAPVVPELPEVLRNVLRIQLEVGDIGIKTVAPRMRLSISQLRSQLRDHGTTYRQLIESVRKQMCLELIDSAQLTIDEVGNRLGYSNTANFYRACKRWFGRTPTDLRHSAHV